VVAEELESVVQVFADVMRSYDLPPAEIERHEEAVRRGGYAVLRAAEKPAAPVVECDLGADCLARRTVTVRPGAPAVGLDAARLPLIVEAVRRDGAALPRPCEATVRAGDELVLAGTAQTFAQAAPLFRVGALDDVAMAEAMADTRTVIDTERVVELVPAAGIGCDHVGQIRPVTPSARGCEDCLRTGDRWVHLRASNTEPVMRIIAEARTQAAAQALVDEYTARVRGILLAE
jgi:hypothetical protein